jgi:hypothetical protein
MFVIRIRLLALAAVVFIGSLPTRSQAQVEFSKAFSEKTQREMMCTVVRIYADDGEKSWQGSGVCIEYNEETGMAAILTAGHVVENAETMTIEVFTENSYPKPAKVYKKVKTRYYWDHKSDLGLVIAKIKVPYVCDLDPDIESLRRGEPVLSVGCGIGAPPVCQVAKLAGLDEESNDYVVERGAVGGRSGGPLISRWGLIGIASRSGEDITLYVSQGKIIRFLKNVQKKRQEEKRREEE